MSNTDFERKTRKDAKIFVHIPKNAGMTIRHSHLLKGKIFETTDDRHKSPEYTAGLKKKMKETNDHDGPHHARWRDLRKDYRERFDAFAIIRNPWDRVVSRYFFAKKVIEVEKKVDKSYADVSSFEAFLEERFKWGDQEYMWHRAIRGWTPAWDYVSDDHGLVSMCDAIRFEYLDEDMIAYFNLPHMTEARNVTALNDFSYQSLYNSNTIKIIGDWYKSDIDHWGFDFDTGAQKNYWNEEIDIFKGEAI